ncbi:esterase [Breoghania sp. L-A4]|uniref:esterase n=1 Tax=Breoghania sp. L-A4 TaxID=2304600 RepID=UPI000E35C16F|nr:esterase [Breoghania sp. L-A4]AXS41990.1 esterase [Breoghania sp. L-A4]
MLDLIGTLVPKRRKSDWPSTVEAIRAGAAYLAQGASYSYLRARTLLAGPRLFQNEDFGFALQICKWEAFAVAAQDLILMLEAELRSVLPASAEARARGLAALYREVLESESVPDHRADTGWGELFNEFDARLAVYMREPPLRPDAISIATALRILKHAPIEDAVREADTMMVVNNVAFRFIDHQATLRKTLDLDAFAAELARRMESEG